MPVRRRLLRQLKFTIIKIFDTDLLLIFFDSLIFVELLDEFILGL